jgi:transcriptional regulator of arginine metabolism
MPKQSTTPSTRQERHRAILELIDGHYIKSQAELQDLLQERGLEVNQGTLSRDLRELRVVKSPTGYELPDAATAAGSATETTPVHAALRLWLLSVAVAQHQIVLRTPPGGAQPLALALDQARYPGVLGTIAGDDTILVICARQRDAARVAKDLEAML